MDATQDKHERAVAERFIEWYNSRNCTAYGFYARGAEPPDFIYRDGHREMPLELTAAYYDQADATMLWQNARGVPEATQHWMSKEPDLKLIESVSATLQKKCSKLYPKGCVLLMAVYPHITSAEEFDALRAEIRIPRTAPFAEIYIAGLFPASSDGSRGGYFCWKLA